MYAETNGNDRVAIAEAATQATTSGRDEDSDHVVIGRLIRRLRVSEAPDRFHTLATNVLRSSLGVEAVAWVPRDVREPVILSGLVDEMDPSSYRLLAQSASPDGESPSEEIAHGRRPRGVPSTVGRYAAAVAGSAGWLVAINTPRGRPFTPSEVERLHYVGALIEAQLANARVYTELKGLLFGIIRR